MFTQESLLSASPWIEVAVKTAYWRSPRIHQLLSPAKRKRTVARPAPASAGLSMERILSAMDSLGARDTSVLLVHSAMKALEPTGLSPREICEQLSAYLGPDATLAMPAIPMFRKEPKGIARMGDAICSQRLVYDVRRTPPWTGALPWSLMSMPDAVRSRHPLNSMVAKGPLASEMMRRNLDGPSPLPCGEQSSWKFCADQDATIVCLGVDASHSLTMIHVHEDCQDGRWPVAGWYRERLFHIKDSDFEADVTVRERHPKWTIHFAERTLQKDLLRQGILKVAYIDGLRIEACNSAKLLDFLGSRPSPTYPYWFPLGQTLVSGM